LATQDIIGEPPPQTIPRSAIWLEGIGVIWIAAVSVRYTDVALRSVFHPFNFGADKQWLMIWAGLVGILLAVRQTRYGTRVLLGGIGILAGLIVVLSGKVAATAITLWLLWLAFRLGSLMTAHLRMDALTRVVTCAGLGLTFLALCSWALAVVQSAGRSVIFLSLGLLTLAALLAGWKYHRRLPVQSLSKLLRHDRADGLPVLSFVWVFLLNLTWAAAPEIQYDALNYHLAVPRIFLQHGGILDLPYFFHSYFMHLADYLFLLGLALDHDSVPKLISLAFSLLAAAGVAVLARQFSSRRAALWAAACFYTIPIVSWEATTTYVDNACAFFAVASLAAFGKWYRHSRRDGWLIVAAVLAAAAVGTKVSAGYAFVVFGVFAVGRCVVRRKWRIVLMFCAAGILVAAPWFVSAYVFTGNPVFPLLNGVFRSPLWDMNNTIMNAADFGVGTSPSALLRLPFRLVLDTTRFGEANPRGTAGFALLMAIPFALGLKRRRRLIALYTLTCGVYFGLWAVTFQYARYFIPMLAVISALGAAVAIDGFRHALPRRIAASCFAVCVALQVAPDAVQYWNIPERFPFGVALGGESPQVFLQRSLGGYGAAEYLNSVVPDGSRVLCVGAEDVRFYINAPVDSLAEALVNSPLKAVSGIQSSHELEHRLRELNITHLLTTRSAAAKPESWYPYLKPGFLSSMTALEWSDESVLVYRIR
jgi:Dolichyl-phosphate-mannose-protein mannosyltransferase